MFMEVILDELTPFEFFSHGGIVKLTVSDELSKECSVKKKYTFFEYKTYMRFCYIYCVKLWTSVDI